MELNLNLRLYGKRFEDVSVTLWQDGDLNVTATYEDRDKPPFLPDPASLAIHPRKVFLSREEAEEL